MMDIRSVYERLEKNKARRKELRAIVQDELYQSREYTETKEDVLTASQRLNRIKTAIVDSRCPNEAREIESLSNEIKNDQEVISDIAMSMIMKGETPSFNTDSKRIVACITLKQMKLL